jgi:hypothetical protein
MQSYLDSIPEGDYLILLSTSDNIIENLSDEVLTSLHEFGCFALDTLKNGKPYGFIGKKGETKPLFESFSNDKSAKLSESYTIRALTGFGTMEAQEVGKGIDWSTFSWKFNGKNTEEFSVNVLENNQLVFSQDNDFEGFASLSDSNLTQNELQFKSSFYDKLNKDLSELDFWMINHKALPEGVVVPEITSIDENLKAKSYQGEKINASLAFVNISQSDFDSIWVYYTASVVENGFIFRDSILLASLKSRDTLILPIKLQNPNFYGNVDLTVQFNPQKQAEQYYSNNIYYGRFTVQKDKTAALVEIKLNDKIPQKNQETGKDTKISITLTDDNVHAIFSDTSSMQLYLYNPCQLEECPAQRIYFSNPNLTYAFKGNQMFVELMLNDLKSGIYTFKVLASDPFGNAIDEPAEISFSVQELTKISAFVPYPSPFSEKMRFAYQMTGSKQPESIHLQIFNNTGVLVFETKDLGDLEAGSNLTQWEWSGVDMKGKQLENGVYFYKVTINDTQIERLSTSVDSKFENGFGTIMISR